MITIAPAQYQAICDDHDARLGEKHRQALAGVNPRSPLLADNQWPQWWRATLEQGRACGVDNTQTLSIHALLRFLFGPDYLGRPELGWLRELLTAEGGEPDYRELHPIISETLDAIDALWMEAA